MIRNTPISLKEKGKSHFEFGVDEPDFKANRNEPNSQSTANFMDIQKEKNGIKKLNSTSYVLNCPDTEIPDYRSTNRNDYADFIGIDRKTSKLIQKHLLSTHEVLISHLGIAPWQIFILNTSQLLIQQV